MRLITPEMLIGALGAVGASFGTVLWFFFKRAYDKLDELKKCLHDMGVRHMERIEVTDAKVDHTREDLSKLFTQVGEMKGFCTARHGHIVPMSSFCRPDNREYTLKNAILWFLLGSKKAPKPLFFGALS